MVQMQDSPGITLDPDGTLALELYDTSQRVGWELLTSLRPIRLSRWRAEMMLMRLEWLHERDRARQRQRPLPVQIVRG